MIFDRSENDNANSSRIIWVIAAIAVTLLFGWVVIHRAWMSDDAYITLRVVDNWISGYGLRWNVTERVQVYTHPLWLLVVSLLYAFTHEAYLTVLLLSVLVSCLVVILLLWKIKPGKASSILGVILLSFSSAFVDFSTSGLENPLSHILLILFFCVYFQVFHLPIRKRLFLLAFLSALSGVNRLDTILITFPMVIFSFWESRKERHLLQLLVLGMLPMAAWEIFSLIYYGFPFPNTYYAKVSETLPHRDLIRQGFLYLWHTIHNDPVTGWVIIIGFVISFVQKNRQRFICSLGACLYLFYVVWVGGDFMEGRFLTLIYLLVVFQLIFFDLDRIKLIHFFWIGILLLVLNFSGDIPTFYAQRGDFIEPWKDGVVNERFFYYAETGLLRNHQWNTSPTFPWVFEGQQAKAQAGSEFLVVRRDPVGFFGYYAGPNVYIIDQLGLGTALTAHTPPYYTPHWRIGHFQRVVADGYETAIIEDDPEQFYDPEYRAFARKMMLIADGNIFSPDRWHAIMQMNGGILDPLVERDDFIYPGIVSISVNGSGYDAGSGTFGNSLGIRCGNSGISLRFSETQHNREFMVDVSGLQAVRLVFSRDSSSVLETTYMYSKLKLPESGEGHFRIPRQIAMNGYDRVQILPVEYRGEDADTWLFQKFLPE